MDVDLYDPNDKEYQRLQKARANMFKTFGTRNFLAVFLPSIRDLPFFGHEWTLEVIELDQEARAANGTNPVINALDIEDEYEGI